MQPSRQRASAFPPPGNERGQVVVFMALFLPVLLALGAIVLTVGNWYTHARHLQTKVDAAAFAGGAVWGFPCGSDIDAAIETETRRYVGDHTAANGTLVTGGYNEMLGGVGGDQIYVALNQRDWWGGAFGAADFSDPSGPVCRSKVLDVKATEKDAPLIWSLLPLFPDIKRKARVQIEEAAGLTGLLPIAVRLPQPLSAAAVFYDESSRLILDVKYFRHVCTPEVPDCVLAAPPGLGQWTTKPADGDTAASWASFPVAASTGVVVATSVRPGCGAGDPPAAQPCLEDEGWVGDRIDDFCRQAAGSVRCYDADGVGGAQTVNSGVHFIRGYQAGSVPEGPNLPEIRGVWLENLSPPDCAAGPYFNATNACLVELNVQVDVGSCLRGPGECFDDPGVTTPEETRRAGAPQNNVQVRYCLVRSGQIGTTACDGQFDDAQDLNCSGGPGIVSCATVAGTHPRIAAASGENAFAVEVRFRNTTVTGYPECQDPGDPKDNCRWFFTGAGYAGDSVLPSGQAVLDAPLQRSFMGDIERTTPLRWLRLTVDTDCDPLTNSPPDQIIDGLTGSTAASQPEGETRCYVVDLGIAGGLARDQDEPPIAFNLGDNSSQRAYVDCDPSAGTNIKSEVQNGCQTPSYAANRFDTSPHCPDFNGFFTVPKPAPFDSWPPFRCVLTQTGNSPQVIQGFNGRLFGRENNPRCPSDANEFVPGRNYWHRMNNMYTAETFAWDGTGPPGPNGAPKGNTLRSDDPRLVTLFFTTYDSFTDTGNEVYPIVGFGNFYVTGYGETRTGRLIYDDPCDGGDDGDLTNGTGREPPPDLDYSRNTRWVWGHFVKDVTPAPFSTGGSGVLCNPEASFQPCVAVLVE